jgi:hypothetical protein
MPVFPDFWEAGEQMADVVVGYLNLAPGDWDGLARTITSLYGPQFNPPEGWRAVKWVHEVDLDRDGTDEIVLAYAVPIAGREDAKVADPTMLAARWSVLAQKDGSYRLAHRGTGDWSLLILDTPRFEFARDVTGDGRLELVVATGSCGAHTCSETLHIGQWDGETWRRLGEPSTTYVDWVRWVDQDGDGSQEVLLHGGTFGSVGAGLQRPSTFVYAYRDGQYQLVQERRDPDTNIYFVMLDAHQAWVDGAYDRALELALQNLAQPAPPISTNERYGTDFEGISDASYGRILAYSGIEAMLAYAHSKDNAAMRGVLAQMERELDPQDNPYLAASRCLWQIYEDTEDLDLACRVMQWTVQRAGFEAGQLLEDPGYATEGLPLDRLCPLGPEDRRSD